MTPELRQESAQFLYVDNKPTFIIKGNNHLEWYKILPATQEDMQEAFSAKSAQIAANNERIVSESVAYLGDKVHGY